MAESPAKEPRGENWITTVVVAVAGILLLGGIITGFVLLAQSCTHHSQSGVALPPCETGIVCVNAYTVGHDYAENEITADAKYKDKIVRVSGRVLEIGRDSSGKAFVDLNSGYAAYLPRFYFNAEDEHLMLGFKYNDEIWIQGTGAGFQLLPNYRFERAVFENCNMAQLLHPPQT